MRSFLKALNNAYQYIRTNKRKPIVDRPAYDVGWKDGFGVGRRQGYTDALNDVRTGKVSIDRPLAGTGEHD